MPKRRVPGEPWYTAAWREPHTMWWGPSVFMLAVLLFVSAVLFDDPLSKALVVAGCIATAHAVFAYGVYRRRRE